MDICSLCVCLFSEEVQSSSISVSECVVLVSWTVKMSPSDVATALYVAPGHILCHCTRV